MIYILDSGYAGKHQILYFDTAGKTDNVGHGTDTVDLVRLYNRRVEICLISSEANKSTAKLHKLFARLRAIVTVNDILLIPWVIIEDTNIDNDINELAALCHVICAAGNNSDSVDYYSPARATNAITVGCLNKSGAPAKLSNHPTLAKPLEYMYGTNIQIDENRTVTGTSASAAIYAALFQRSLQFKNRTKFMEKATAQLKKQLTR